MSTTDRDNPFAPPKAEVLEAARAEDGEYVPEGRKVDSGRGVGWFTEAWDLFKRSPGLWVGMFIVFFVCSMVLAIIPLGGLVSTVLYPVIAGGIMLGCRELEQGRALEFSHFFAGFQKHAGSLMLVGVMYLVCMIVIGVIVGIVFALFIPFMAMKANPNDLSGLFAMAPFFVLAVLIGMALALPVIMAMWFAPAIVTFHNEQPVAAMKASFRGCLRNFMPFLVYGIVGIVLMIVALIPFGLGLLVFAPIIWITMYTGYRDIFLVRA